MNCLANARIAKKFKQKIFVPFAPDDLGLSIGSAMYANQYIFKKEVNMKSSHLQEENLVIVKLKLN